MTDVLTPATLKQAVKESKEPKSSSESLNTAKTEVKIMNQTLSDVNEVLKTVNSIGSHFGFNLKDILDKKKETQGVATKIEAGVQKGVAEQMQSYNPESKTKAELKIHTNSGIVALLEFLDGQAKTQPDKKLSEWVEEVKVLNSSGVLDSHVEDFIRKYVGIKQ